MFHVTDLESFTGNLSSLVDGHGMFEQSDLTSFNSNLSSLKCGDDMFKGCSLNESSLSNITNTINDISELNKDTDSDWTYQIGDEMKVINNSDRGLMTVTVDSSVTETQKNNFVSAMNKKGWTVSFVV